ncbi:MAG: ATP-binding protein [Verrucomicrobiota bacterium]
MSKPTEFRTVSSHSRPQHGLLKANGTLYIAILSKDAEINGNLKTDLGRSQIKDHKLQICKSVEEATRLLAVSRFHLLFLDLKDFEGDQSAFDKLREKNTEMPVIGLAHRRAIMENRVARYLGLDDLVAKEDLSPSLVESVARNAIERKGILDSRRVLHDRLALSLSADHQGQWTYYPEDDSLELDAITSALFSLEPRPTRIPIAVLRETIAEADHPKLETAFACLDGEDRETRCTLQILGETIPQPQVELIGRSAPPDTLGTCVLIGIARPATQAREIVQRILEANTAVQELLDQRDADLRAANRHLRSLAAELDLPPSPSNSPSPQPNPKADIAPTPAEEPALSSNTKRAKSATQPSTPEPESPVPTKPVTRKSPPPSKGKTKDDLKFDSEQAFAEVLKSIQKQQAKRPKRAKQQSLPFDFSTDPVSDFSPPNPTQEGFIGAAKRLVAMIRATNELDVNLSISDQQAIQNERERDLLFDVLRELLTNVARHAQASLCIISLFRDEDDWVLQVEDDGIGIDDTLKSVSTPLKQIGLFQIRTKLALKGGHLDMTPASPSGLVARARLPYTARETVKR